MYYVAYSKDHDLIWPYKEHLIWLEMWAIYQIGTYLHPEKNQLSYNNILFDFLFCTRLKKIMYVFMTHVM